MGQIWRGTDTQLNRRFARNDGHGADADRLAWFQREVRVLASLNHPLGVCRCAESDFTPIPRPLNLILIPVGLLGAWLSRTERVLFALAVGVKGPW